MKELQPINQNVLIEFPASGKEEKTVGGIIIPDTAKEKPFEGRVAAIANIENCEIGVGDTVIYNKFSGTEVSFEGKKYLVIPYADILMKIVTTESI